MPMITLVYVCLLCMAAVPFTHQQGQFTNFTASGHSFFLSHSKKSQSEAKTGCERTEAELALFDTNDEYYGVSEQLSNERALDAMWVNLMVKKISSEKFELWWKDEQINSSVWGQGEPSNNCDDKRKSFNPSDCCARVVFSGNNKNSLKDRDCIKQFYFLCKCSKGFRANSNGECNDFDECTENVCSGNLLCVNTGGSYECVCLPGFYQTLDNRCQNIDECQNGTHQCEQICHDTQGSYMCSCQPGYARVPYNQTQCRNINECEDGSHNCSQICHDTLGGFTCSCNQSYVNASNDHSNCTDRDECVENLHNCQHFCNNTEGSFKCSCYSGFQLNSDGSSCDNINECLEDNGKCEQLCNDSDGSFKCDCTDGYVLSENGFSCQEINRCQDGSHNCTQNCSITQDGGYICSCYNGYINISDDHSQCEDIDECKNPHPCQHICNNTDGSFKCFCREGFVLGEDGVSCEKVDECKDNSTECPQSCNNTNGSEVCGSKGEPTYESNNTSIPSSFVQRLCVCPCKLQSIIKSNITQNYVRKLREKITKVLLMPTYNLSAERRRKTSAQDGRPSSQSIGCIGITFMAVILGLMFFCDILSFFKARHQ